MPNIDSTQLRARLSIVLGRLLMAFALMWWAAEVIVRLRLAQSSGQSFALWFIFAPSGILPTLAIPALGAGGLKFVRHGKRMLTATADEILNSGGPIVLYLRSFREDRSTAMVVKRKPSQLHFVKLEEPTDEEDLISALKPFGSCIAIGDPSETLSPIGAARMYVGTDEWRDRVRWLMGRATLVVARAADSAGFLWEMRQISVEISHSKFLLYVPLAGDSRANGRRYRELRRALNHCLPRRLPSALRGSSLLVFSEGWHPRVVPSLGCLATAAGSGVTGSQAYNLRRQLSQALPALEMSWCDHVCAYLSHVIVIGLAVGVLWYLTAA